MAATLTPLPVATGPTTRRRRSSKRHNEVPFLFIVPALILFSAIVLIPSLLGASLSFTDSGLGKIGNFIGFDNYAHAFNDPAQRAPLVQTLIMATGVTVLQNVFGLLLALALNTHIKSRGPLRVLFFLPFVMSPLVTGFLWKYLLLPDGPINTVLGAVGLGSLQQPWLGQPGSALGAIIVTSVWQYTGSTMVIYLAGLQAIPKELIEAAHIDGAGPVKRLRYVVGPLLLPAITVNVTLCLIGGLRIYDQIMAMTSGGPGGSTDSLSTMIYQVAFNFNQFGYGAALAVILTILVLIVSGIQYVALQRKAN